MTSYAGRYAGKVAVVTGAAQGIGRTVAARIAHEGGSLALVDRSPLVEEVRHETEAACAAAIAIIADLETFAGATAAIDNAQQHFGRIDILVNNEFDRQGLDARSCSLRLALCGAEPWSVAMRSEIESRLGLAALDIYGLSELMGPGVGQEFAATRDGPTI